MRKQKKNQNNKAQRKGGNNLAGSGWKAGIDKLQVDELMRGRFVDWAEK